MALIDDINWVLRDFTVDGDPQSGVPNIDKGSLREVMIAMLQAQGDPEALQEIVDELAQKVGVDDLQALRTDVTAALVRSPNLFNPAATLPDRAVSETTGELVANGNSVASAAIPVQGGETYKFSTLQRFAWYTASDVFILGQFAGGTDVERTAPANAAFLRVSLPEGTDLATHMITLARDWPDAFVPFGLVPDISYAPLPEDRLAETWKRGFLVPGRNMIDESAATVGVFVVPETGVMQGNPSLRATAMIPVEGGGTYAFSGGDVGTTGARAVAQYDADGVLIPTPLFTSPVYRQSVTLEAATRFVRVSYHSSADGAIQMEKGSVPTAYVPYTLVPSPDVGGTRISWQGDDGASAAQPYAYSYGLERLREARTRVAAYRMGLAGRKAQLRIGLVGDSWMMIPSYYARWLAQYLWGRLTGPEGFTSRTGMIGRGYMTFRDDNASGSKQTARLDAIGYTMTIGGAWSRLSNNQASASINGQRSDEVGAYVEWPMDYTLTPARSLTLHAQGGAGAVRYRWTETGAWTVIDLSAMPAGVAVVPLAGMPSSGSGTFRLEVATAPVALFGMMEIAADAPGLAVNNLGGSGSTSAQWVAVDRDQFIAAVAATDCDMFEVTLGTNDAGVGISKAQFKSNIREIVDRLRTARPTADILLSSPAQTTDPTRPIPVRLYAEAVFELAQELDVAFIDLQPSFGEKAQDYAPGSDRPFFGDLVHPGQLGGLSRATRFAAAIGI